MKFVLLINLKLLTISNSFLLNISELENFSANKYENLLFTIVGIFIFTVDSRYLELAYLE